MALRVTLSSPFSLWDRKMSASSKSRMLLVLLSAIPYRRTVKH
jgi:hypothetical protein